MKGCVIEANIGGQGQGWLPVFGSNLGVEIFLKKRKHHEKGVMKQKIQASLYTLRCDFKIVPFTLYTYVLAKILPNDVKFKKSHEKF